MIASRLFASTCLAPSASEGLIDGGLSPSAFQTAVLCSDAEVAARMPRAIR